MFFDTHAHYDQDAFDSDRMELLAKLPEQGISLVLNPGIDIQSSHTAVELADAFPHVYAAVGVHPSETGGFSSDSDLQLCLDTMKNLAKHEKVKAIGEVGLDFYHEDNPPPEVQEKVFRGHIELAEELKLPLIIHDREAHQHTYDVLKSYGKGNEKGVYHCYSGSVEYAKTLLDLGYIMSFTGVITYKNARKTLEVLEYLPMDAIMIETDAPFLTPVPFRGKRNDSSKLSYTAQALADLKGISLEECAKITTENGKRFFHIQ